MGCLAFVKWWFRLNDEDELWELENELDPPFNGNQSLLDLIYSQEWDDQFVEGMVK